MSFWEEWFWFVVVILCSLAAVTFGVVWLYQAIPDDPFGLGELDL